MHEWFIFSLSDSLNNKGKVNLVTIACTQSLKDWWRLQFILYVEIQWSANSIIPVHTQVTVHAWTFALDKVFYTNQRRKLVFSKHESGNVKTNSGKPDESWNHFLDYKYGVPWLRRQISEGSGWTDDSTSITSAVTSLLFQLGIQI